MALGALLSFFPLPPCRLPRTLPAPSGSSFSNNTFAFNLLHAVLEQDMGHHNMLISPMSVLPY